MCCEINIVGSISLKIGVNVHEWFLSPLVPHNKPLYVNTGIDFHRWTTCMCDRCVLGVKLTIDPTLIKCPVKLTLFIQFR